MNASRILLPLRDFLLLSALLLLAACGGGGGGGGGGSAEPSPPAKIAWINVDSSSVAPASGGTSTASVSGSAFVSKQFIGHQVGGFCLLLCWYDNSYPGVEVLWENQTLVAGGSAQSRFGTATDWQHLWSASIPVTTGSNTIKIHARDPAGNSASTTLMVQYSDVTPPTVNAISPPDGASGIGTNSPFTVHFSEAMSPASISAATILLKDNLDNAVFGTVGYSNQVATFTPSSSLKVSTQYTATVSTGVKDLAGNALPSPYASTFTTAAAPDTTPPTVVSTLPTNGTTCVSTETELSTAFSESVLDSTVNASTFLLKDSSNNPIAGTVSFNSSSGQAVFTPNVMLANSSDYMATLTTGITDLAGNHLGTDYTWAFTTQAAGAGVWRATTKNFAPAPRSAHTAVWTGSQMIIWGGRYGSTGLGDGARYDPTTDTWTPVSSVGAPSARYGHVAVWTGTKMIIWGGTGAQGQLATGAIYDPATDSWTSVSSSGAPLGRDLTTAVWTGTEMIVWGGYSTFVRNWLNDGARYNPSTNSWSPVSAVNAPLKRYGHTAIWTGSSMIIWGGGDNWGSTTTVGGIYTPASDSWMATPTTGAPSARSTHVAVWTGNEMIIWGPDNTGARYHPTTNSWQATSTSCAPMGSYGGTIGVWSGTELIVWGALSHKVGGRYNPNSDTWQATPVVGVPDARQRGTGIWTGTELIIWGGEDPAGASLNSGGVYRPQ